MWGRITGVGPRFLRAQGVAAIAALLIAPSILVCGPTQPPRFERIVFVSLDTVRADHLGLYGYPRETSPFLDELASEGAVFERAYAPMPTTAPSHATMFTALYPIQHGVLGNGLRLPDAIETLAEIFLAADFTTAGFVGTHAQWVPTGLSRGFETFNPRPRESDEVYRQADRTVDAALAWLGRCDPCERLFLFVHLFDAHGPLQPPDRHLQVFQSEAAETRERHAAFLQERPGIPLAFYRNDTGGMLFIADRYDAEIHFADAQLRRLYEGMRERGLLEGSLWVVTADHGEGLGNHAFMGHGKAYEEDLRVPLFFHAVDGSLAARRVADLTEHVDLRPTLLELAGLPPEPATAGSSLVPQLMGEPEASPRAVFAQRGRIAQGPHVRRMPQEDPGDLSGDQYAWIEQRWKYLHHLTGDDELYDLEADPLETHDLLQGTAPPVAERLRKSLASRIDELRSSAVAAERPPKLSEETKQELRALGYAP
jgi:arylsulfatase A-like enzyme